MIQSLLLIGAAALAAFGFALIALSQNQHRILSPAIARAQTALALRLVGSLSIGLSAVLAVLRDGLAFGLLLWTAMLTIAAFAVVGGLAKLRTSGGRQRREP